MSFSSLYKLKQSNLLRLKDYRVGRDFAMSPSIKFLMLGVRRHHLVANLAYTCFLARRAALFLYGTLARYAHPAVILGYHYTDDKTAYNKLIFNQITHIRVWIPGIFTNWPVVSTTALRAEGALEDIGMIFQFPDIMLLFGINDRVGHIVREAEIIELPTIAAADASLDFTKVTYHIPTNYRLRRSSDFYLDLFYSIREESGFFRTFRYFSVFKGYVRYSYFFRSLKRKLTSIKSAKLGSVFNQEFPVSVPVSAPASTRLWTRFLFPYLGYFSYGYLAKRASSGLFFRSMVAQVLQKRRRIIRLKRLMGDSFRPGYVVAAHKNLKKVFQDLYFPGHVFDIKDSKFRRLGGRFIKSRSKVLPVFNALRKLLLSEASSRKLRRTSGSVPMAPLPKNLTAYPSRPAPLYVQIDQTRSRILDREVPQRIKLKSLLPSLSKVGVFETLSLYKALRRKYPKVSKTALFLRDIYRQRPLEAPYTFAQYLDYYNRKNRKVKRYRGRGRFRRLDSWVYRLALRGPSKKAYALSFFRKFGPFRPAYWQRAVRVEKLLFDRNLKSLIRRRLRERRRLSKRSKLRTSRERGVAPMRGFSTGKHRTNSAEQSILEGYLSARLNKVTTRAQDRPLTIKDLVERFKGKDVKKLNVSPGELPEPKVRLTLSTAAGQARRALNLRKLKVLKAVFRAKHKLVRKRRFIKMQAKVAIDKELKEFLKHIRVFYHLRVPSRRKPRSLVFAKAPSSYHRRPRRDVFVYRPGKTPRLLKVHRYDSSTGTYERLWDDVWLKANKRARTGRHQLKRGKKPSKSKAPEVKAGSKSRSAGQRREVAKGARATKKPEGSKKPTGSEKGLKGEVSVPKPRKPAKVPAFKGPKRLRNPEGLSIGGPNDLKKPVSDKTPQKQALKVDRAASKDTESVEIKKLGVSKTSSNPGDDVKPRTPRNKPKFSPTARNRTQLTPSGKVINKVGGGGGRGYCTVSKSSLYKKGGDTGDNIESRGKELRFAGSYNSKGGYRDGYDEAYRVGGFKGGQFSKSPFKSFKSFGPYKSLDRTASYKGGFKKQHDRGNNQFRNFQKYKRPGPKGPAAKWDKFPKVEVTGLAYHFYAAKLRSLLSKRANSLGLVPPSRFSRLTNFFRASRGEQAPPLVFKEGYKKKEYQGGRKKSGFRPYGKGYQGGWKSGDRGAQLYHGRPGRPDRPFNDGGYRARSYQPGFQKFRGQYGGPSGGFKGPQTPRNPPKWFRPFNEDYYRGQKFKGFHPPKGAEQYQGTGNGRSFELGGGWKSPQAVQPVQGPKPARQFQGQLRDRRKLEDNRPFGNFRGGGAGYGRNRGWKAGDQRYKIDQVDHKRGHRFDRGGYDKGFRRGQSGQGFEGPNEALKGFTESWKHRDYFKEAGRGHQGSYNTDHKGDQEDRRKRGPKTEHKALSKPPSEPEPLRRPRGQHQAQLDLARPKSFKKEGS